MFQGNRIAEFLSVQTIQYRLEQRYQFMYPEFSPPLKLYNGKYLKCHFRLCGCKYFCKQLRLRCLDYNESPVRFP